MSRNKGGEWHRRWCRSMKIVTTYTKDELLTRQHKCEVPHDLRLAEVILSRRLLPWLDKRACCQFLRTDVVSAKNVAFFVHTYPLLVQNTFKYQGEILKAIYPVASKFKPGDTVKPLLPLITLLEEEIEGIISIIAMDERGALPYPAPFALNVLAGCAFHFLLACLLDSPEDATKILPIIMPIVVEKAYYYDVPIDAHITYEIFDDDTVRVTKELPPDVFFIFEPLIHLGAIASYKDVIFAISNIEPKAERLLELSHIPETDKPTQAREIISSFVTSNDLKGRTVSAMLTLLASTFDCPMWLLGALAQSKYRKARVIAELRYPNTPAKRIRARLENSGKATGFYRLHLLAIALLHPNFPDDMRFSLVTELSKWHQKLPTIFTVLCDLPKG